MQLMLSFSQRKSPCLLMHLAFGGYKMLKISFQFKTSSFWIIEVLYDRPYNMIHW